MIKSSAYDQLFFTFLSILLIVDVVRIAVWIILKFNLEFNLNRIYGSLNYINFMYAGW